MDRLFLLANAFAAIGWLLLIVAPRWRWTERLVLSGLWSVLLALVYTTLIALYFPTSQGGFGSIAEVRQLFAGDALLVAGWVHYLSFDLLVGAMEARRAQAESIPHAVLIPILIATFLFGPVGLLLFFVVHVLRQRGSASWDVA
jgi:hypothetical protein